MRILPIAAAVAATLALGGCGGFVTAGGAAAKRWAALEKARVARANADPSVPQVCRAVTVTGSVVPQRICSTQAEWDATDAMARADAEAFNREMRSGNAEPGRDGMQGPSGSRR